MRIDLTPNWYQTRSRSPGDFAFDHQDSREFGLAIVGQYDAENSDSEPEARQKELNDQILLVPFAFWCAQPSSFTGGRIVHYLISDDGSSIRTTRGARVIPLPSETSAIYGADDVVKATKLFGVITALSRDGTLRAVIRMVHKALTESMWDVRFALHWVALEALYGVSSKGELRFRLSTHLALFLGANEEERKALAKKAKGLYDIRSKIVHGLQYSGVTRDQAVAYCGEVEVLVRSSLVKILLGNDRETFDSRKRDEYFNALIFRDRKCES